MRLSLRGKEQILYAVIALLFGGALIMAYDMNAKIAHYPKIVCTLGFALSLVLIARSFFQGHSEERGTEVSTMPKTLDRSQQKRIVASLGITLTYIVCISLIGYIVSTFTFMVALMSFLKKRFKIVYIAVALVSVTLVYLVFTLFLKIPLPKGLLV